MSFRKPFRAVPIVPSAKYRARVPRRRSAVVAKALGAAMLGGLLAGTLAAGGAGGFANAASNLHEVAISQGLARRTTPAAGDYWPGCNAAREAGVAPLYAGEPGYREAMDGDGDGVACEPHRQSW
ncbi:MAG TPA: excalibur calcium-binding domain-containing protein [Allosphingosinicella sp.]|jgi:hypothetical protein